MHLAVLNPGGNDKEQSFPDFAGAPDNRVHAPVNYHAYAACTQGTFSRDQKAIPQHATNVLMLLGNSMRPALRAIDALRQLAPAQQLALQCRRGRAFHGVDLVAVRDEGS